MRRFALAAPTLFLSALLWLLLRDAPRHETSASLPALPQAATNTDAIPQSDAFSQFEEWRLKLGDREPTRADWEKGLEIARGRKALMLQWMAEDPGRALANSISRRQYHELPERLKPFFEQPFNDVASLRILPVCGAASYARPIQLLETGGRSYLARLAGLRATQGSKTAAPLSGLLLDDRAVVREAPLESLTPEDEAFLAGLPLAGTNAEHDFSTGVPLGPEAVTALAGGKRYRFANEASLADFNQRLGEFDNSPGPHGGSRVLLALPDGGSTESGFDWDEAEDWVEHQASAWTETPKSVFFIRVDFPDLVSPSISQGGLEGILNTTVATSISQMSYGKTTLHGSASPMVIRMPQPASYYAPDKNAELHFDAKAAYLAAAGAAALNGYDIIGVHFRDIGMKNGGQLYAGLASVSGGDQWIQAVSDPITFIHEFGHNYGLFHSSFWSTSDGSAAGPTGTTEEYGDIFDMMGDGDQTSCHFGPYGKFSLNWITSSQVTSILSPANSGTYRIHRFDDPATTGPKRAIRVITNSAPSETFWIGYRPGIAGNVWLPNGAFFTWQKNSTGKPWLVDTSPGSPAGKDDCAIQLGNTYSDPARQFHVTPVARGGTGADAWLDVNVQYGDFSSNGAPTLSLQMPANGSARVPTTLTANASDPDGDALVYLWNFGDGTSTTGSATISHQWNVGGTYQVRVTANDLKGRTATTTSTITVSDPLTNWQVQPFTGSGIAIVNYLGGRFIGSTTGAFWFSGDGATWQSRAIESNVTPQEIAYDGDTFLARTQNLWGYGLIYRSSGGKNWEQVTSFPPTTSYLFGLACGNGIWLVTAENGKIWRSPDDGQTWTSVTVTGSPPLGKIIFGNGVFVATAFDTSKGASIFTSADGITWTNRSATGSVASLFSFRSGGGLYANGTFLAWSNMEGIWRSTDAGVTWTQGITPQGLFYEYVHIVQAPGFLLCTAKRNNTRVCLISTDQGVTWTESPAPQNIQLPVYADGKLVSANYDFKYTASLLPPTQAPIATLQSPTQCSISQEILFRASATDPDGDPVTLLIDFGDGSEIVETPNSYHSFKTGGTFQVKLYATDRRGGLTVVTRTVNVYDPLATWTRRETGTENSFDRLAVGGGRVVATGGAAGGYRVSTDGITWTAGSVGENAYFSGLIYDGNRFVGCGVDYNASNRPAGAIFISSPDGSSWTRQLLPAAPLNGIAYQNGRYVAVGNGVTLFYSSDAVTWTPATPPALITMQAVASGNGTFVAVGGSSGSATAFTSPDGISWTDRRSGIPSMTSSPSLSNLDFVFDRFFASGQSTPIFYSTDGGTSFTSNGASRWIISTVAGGNGIYLACGIEMPFSQTNLISTDGVTWSTKPSPTPFRRNDSVFFNNTFITVGDYGEIWQSGTVVPPFPPGYAAWKAYHFPGGLPLSGADDDADGDGMPNLGEYATGTNPRDPKDRIHFTGQVADGYFTLTVPKTSGAEVACHFEYSPDMVDWTTNGVSIVEDSALQLVARVPVAGKKAGFLRPVFSLP